MTRLPRRTLILTRISDARDGDEHGVQAQEKSGRLLADRLGWTVGPGETHVIVENDTSAYHRRRVCRACLRTPRTCLCPPLPDGSRHETVLRTIRPGFRRALDMLRDGDADGLIALDLDRACRDPRDLEDLIDVVESKRPSIPVESVTGSLRLGSSADRTMARVMVTVANKSSEDTGRRVAMARKGQAEAGRYGGGRRPYGFGVQRVSQVTGEPLFDEDQRPVIDMTQANEAEAAVIRQIADQILAGVSLRAVTADLRAREIPTVTGAAWSTGTVRDMLLRPRNAGLAVYQVREEAQAYKDRGEPVPYDAGVIGPAEGWAVILPEDQWRAVAALLTDPSRRTSPGNTPRWLGSLIYRCGVCAAAGVEETVSISAGAAEREPAYTCRGPVGHLRRSAANVDGYVTDVVVARLSQPDAAELFTRREASPEVDRAALASELNTLRQRSTQLSEAHADGAITIAQLRAGSERVNARIREIEALMAVTVMRSPLDALPLGTDQVGKIWDTLPLGTRRAVLRLLMDVTLLKGKPGRYANGSYFDGSTVEVNWRQ